MLIPEGLVAAPDLGIAPGNACLPLDSLQIAVWSIRRDFKCNSLSHWLVVLPRIC